MEDGGADGNGMMSHVQQSRRRLSPAGKTVFAVDGLYLEPAHPPRGGGGGGGLHG